MDETLSERSGEEADLFSYRAPVLDTEDDGITGEAFIRRLLESGAPAYNINFLLRLEAYSLQLAYSHNKILSLSNSRTRILAHQVESTHRVMSALNQRFLIADEVGLGKTIEAGLIIKELEYRHQYRRMLIVCPASLMCQWQNEMQSKFNDRFAIMDRRELRRIAQSKRGVNPWEAHDKIICSLDFIKNRRYLKMLQETSWDAVIFDEAHRLRRDGKRATLAYEAAQVIAERTRALLLLTATPFRGVLEELYYLIALLDPNILGPFQSYYYDYCIENADLSTLRGKIAPVLIRRTKQEVGGFTRRCARTVRFELYPDERELYDATTQYVAEEFNRAMQSENRAVGFVMTIFQKLLDSSTHALGCALERRMNRLRELADKVELSQRLDGAAAIDEPDLIDCAEEVDDLVCMTSRSTVAEMRKEADTLERLVGLSRAIAVNKKAEKLADLIRSLKRKGFKKFLIFTQFRTTQDYLSEFLKGHDIEVFHGSLGRDDKERAIARFRDEAQILISTEAGGEGRNMQFCNILINYDLPWSPLKIEQRIGRLHRFGQADDVYIYNFSTKDTVAERVLEILARKLRLFEESIGAPDVLLGQIEDELKLGSLFMEMAAGLRSNAAVDDEVERRLELARRGYEKISELAVADRIDFNYDEYYRVTLKERKFSNSRIENFVNRLMESDDGAARFLARDRDGLYRVACENEGGEPVWRAGTFDSVTALDREQLEFLAFGHPVIDRLVAHCQDRAFGGFTGIQSVRHPVPFTGMVFYYLVTFTSVARTREIIPVAVVPDAGLSPGDIDAIEEDLLGQECSGRHAGADDGAVKAIARRGYCFAEARGRINKKIEARKAALSEGLDVSIDPEIEKIRESYDRRIAELAEKLELLEAQYKWYGRNLKSTITRTKNLIEKAKNDRDSLLLKYKGFLGIGHEIELLCAGILVSDQD
ncbi:MAG TPA: SNF2-related protein [Spirochaetota bacterium]|nr:SNF2-related protein [Spirochaetota bacterium]HPV40697.1 SNF2-related protein [Spirochaetota bacterium]